MTISVFDLFSIGIGPSSSHTVGPMRAAYRFAKGLSKEAERVICELYGSLAMTGEGHASDLAIFCGLEGETPEGVDSNGAKARLEEITASGKLHLMGEREIGVELHFCKGKRLPYHSNGMRFRAQDGKGQEVAREVFYSVGGGFVVDEKHAREDHLSDFHEMPYPFKTFAGLLAHCQGRSIVEVMWANELSWRSEDEVRAGLLQRWEVMRSCVERGCQTEGILPGGLGVKRRAAGLYRDLGTETMDRISAYAIAVNEENAAGGRLITAPTNGAAGIIPAVLRYYDEFVEESDENGVCDFLLVAGAIGILYKEGASISAAEVGCQGEIGVACSMAAAGLAHVMGGTLEQIENAAEIGMEHNLGLTCDPVGGLVQIPCIERNAMGAIKAVNAARLALRGSDPGKVTLDSVIATMRRTGRDMQTIYKETSKGGLAVNVPEC